MVSSIYRKIIEADTLPISSRENKARRMILNGYPDSVIVDYIGDEYRGFCERMNSKVYNETIQEIKKQAKDSRMHREDYFDGIDAIAKTYGLTKKEVESIIDSI